MRRLLKFAAFLITVKTSLCVNLLNVCNECMPVNMEENASV
jgi:hypothetical protein